MFKFLKTASISASDDFDGSGNNLTISRTVRSIGLSQLLILAVMYNAFIIGFMSSLDKH